MAILPCSGRPPSLQGCSMKFGCSTRREQRINYPMTKVLRLGLVPGEAASNLSVNLGLRYEFQNLDQPVAANPQFPRTGVIPQDKNNFAPRIALAWQPSQRSIVRTSYGIYFGPLPLQVNSIAKIQNGVFQNIREFRGAAPGDPVYPSTIEQPITRRSARG